MADLRRKVLSNFGLMVLMGANVESADLPPADAGESADAKFYRGPMSLAVLCRLEGYAISADQINARLSRKTAHSLAELRDVARQCGVSLSGVRIGASEWPLDRPAIVHLNRNGVGHFAVIQSVGHSGKLVQILDSSSGVEVMDAVQLFSSLEWTGTALVPSRIWKETTVRAAVFMTIIVVIII